MKSSAEKVRSLTPPYKVLFVCLGNICRSPAAEGILQSIVDEKSNGSRWVIDSAGLYSGHAGQLPDQRMRIHARRRGYELTHHARPVTPADFTDFDLIVAMDDNNYHSLRRMAPSLADEAKIVPMINFVRIATSYDHIPDPYYEGSEGFELVLDLLEDGCRNLFESVTNNGNDEQRP
ncbi:MAG: low molecular weight phosphotyrosine protein phosphatase [Muribaculum sp.]|nr:low molecular weight phosphotyrosine protein phosphatase [Muribaculaceae bacterium]MCM1081424.1 low molecular weight phosphotyrosine protein phosphatase [Muribaculum sp.]